MKAKTMTISMPDWLLDELEQYKKKFNVSKVCQIAIKKEIEDQKKGPIYESLLSSSL